MQAGKASWDAQVQNLRTAVKALAADTGEDCPDRDAHGLIQEASYDMNRLLDDLYPRRSSDAHVYEDLLGDVEEYFPLVM